MLGIAAGLGTAAQLSSEGLEVHVRANSSKTLSAQATDLAGNGSTCSRSITYAQDSIPPETTIDSGPAPDTVNPDASFTLSSDDPSATFSCSLDSGAFRQCARRKTYPQLPAGRHTLRARARDAAGNVDRSPARLTFTLRADAPPNILLIITDDQPLDTMLVMPNALQFFAAEGTEFPHGYDVEPLCCPSRASIFSGKYPHNHGITINDGTGFDATDTWQRYLHELGYFTGITGKYLNAVATSKAPYFDYRFQVTPHDNPDEPALLTARSAEFLNSAEANDRRPWAFVYSTSSPHSPWNVEPENPQPLPSYDPPPSISETELSDKHPAVAARAAGWNPARTKIFRDGILRELQASDEALGSLFDRLGQLSEEQNTLAIYISDNGFLWGQHSITGKVWPYLESVNVPFYLRWPGHAGAGETSPNLVANLDIAPTIFEAARIGPGYPLDGRSLLDSAARDWLLLESPTEVARATVVFPDHR